MRSWLVVWHWWKPTPETCHLDEATLSRHISTFNPHSPNSCCFRSLSITDSQKSAIKDPELIYIHLDTKTYSTAHCFSLKVLYISETCIYTHTYTHICSYRLTCMHVHIHAILTAESLCCPKEKNVMTSLQLSVKRRYHTFKLASFSFLMQKYF